MEVILHIGEKQFLMDISEALVVCNTLNACTRLSREWIDSNNSQALMFCAPDIRSAYITPITAVTKLEVEANMKLKAEKSR
jgi:hypothetical protein